MWQLLLLVQEFEALELRNWVGTPQLIFYHELVVVNQPDCSVFEARIIPGPISVEIEEVFDDDLSEVGEVFVQKTLDMMCSFLFVEALHGFGNKNHYWNTVQVTQIVVVDSTSFGPQFDENRHLTENEHVFLSHLRDELFNAILQAENGQEAIDTFRTFQVADAYIFLVN